MISIAEVPEADADGAVAALYADIRQTTGEPGINLIYRHLATTPPTFAWAWQCLRPLFADECLQAAGRDVRSAMLDVLPPRPLMGASLPETDLDQVRAVLAFYLRTNPQNLVALSVLDAVLRRDSGEAADAEPPSTSGPPPSSTPGIVPPLPRLEDLEPAVRADVNALGARLSAGADDMPMPSVPRHLAYWPPVLSLWQTLLDDPAAQQDGERAAAVMAERSARHGRSLAARLDPALSVEPGEASDRAMIGDTVGVFRRLLPPVTAAVTVLSARLG